MSRRYRVPTRLAVGLLTLLLTVPHPSPEAAPVLSAAPPPAADPDDRAVVTLWGWPLAGTPDVAHGFDPPAQRWLPGHRGIDLVGVAGENVLAVDAGVVTYSGQIAGVGIVSVTHPSGLRSTYQPVADRLPRAARVGRGERLGSLDVGGHCVLADCLHLGAVRGHDRYVDPTPLLLGVRLRLLPFRR
ncbi:MULTISPECIES: M23 family metallopeptidase [unclassified Ornithinimicrobium]|uniref:M23 family metallopeptidase n=1 Tax=unclassified Ornithinimicrobium TaxID=2615080 RepID=UPI003853E7F2